MLLGLAGGFLPIAIFGWPLLLPGASLRSIPWATFLILNPSIGACLGCLFHRYPTARRWHPPSFFAIESLPLQERQARGRRIGLFASTGFGLGILAGLLATFLEVAWRSWPYLAQTLIPALLIYPWLGALAGLNFGQRPGDPKPSIRRLAVSLRAITIAVAYIALLLGSGTQAVRLSREAGRRQAFALSARSTGDSFRNQRDQFAAEVRRRRENAADLRRGRISRDLRADDQAFLNSLDETAGEQDRKARYARIADVEEERAKQAEQLYQSYDWAANHQEMLVEKYTKAAREPWAPVGADPPLP